MYTVEVSLENIENLRLTLAVAVPVRNTPYENEACKMAEAKANSDPMHSKYGPWTAKSSKFIN